MKLILLIISILCLNQLSAQTKKDKLYPFKTAEVVYSYEGNTSGTQTLYIDNYGWLQCEIVQTVAKAFGQKTETNTAKVSIDFDIYGWDLKTKAGSKIRNTMAEDLMNDPSFNPEEFGKRTMDQLGFERIGNESVCGKLCDVWKGMAGTSTIWMWNGLTMKSEVKMLGTKTIWTATSVEIDGKVSPDRFILPSDVQFTDEGTTDPEEMMNRGIEKAKLEEENGVEPEAKPDEAVDSPIKSLKELNGLLKKIK